MKPITKYILTALVAVATPFNALAQQKGRVVDNTGQGVAFANVVAMSAADSTIVAACVSNEKGYYKMPATSNKPELLRISALGYEPLFYHCNTPIEQLTLTLKPLKEVSLSEASVVYKRPVAHIDGDAIVTSVQGTTLSKVGSAEDVLRQVPGIIKKNNDKDGTLEVIGSGTPQVYLNGRILRDLNELKQLRSEDIKSVEVVNNPGANYDASVKAIVRIKTVKRKGEGWGVNLSNDYEQGENANNFANLRLNYQKNGLNIALGSGASTGKYQWLSNIEQYTQTPDTLWYLPTKNPNLGKYRWFNEFAEVNYDINDKHTIGARYQINFSKVIPTSSRVESDVLANGEYYDRLVNTIYNEEDNKPQHSLNAYYVGQIGKGELRIDADFFAKGKTEIYRYDEKSEAHESRNFPTINNNRNRIVYTKAQYAFPWLKGKVSIGGQFNHTNRHDNYYVEQAQYGISSANSQLVETTEAAFVQYATMIRNKVQFSAGLRYEHLQLDYYNNDERIAAQSPSYNNLFPSLNVSTQLGKAQMMLAYNVQTSRPSYSQLSNNVTYGNRFLLLSGNPNLKATIEHKVSLTAVYKWYQFVLRFYHAKDEIIYWGESVPEKPSVTKISNINKDISSLTATTVISPKIGFWNPTLTVNLIKHFFDIEALVGRKVRLNPLCYFDFKNTFNLPKGYDFTIDYSLTTKGNIQNMRMQKNRHYLECYLSKSFLKDALTLTIGGEDLLKNSGNNTLFYMTNSQFVQTAKGDTRLFYLKLNYTFNAIRSKYKGSSDVNEVIKRL